MTLRQRLLYTAVATAVLLWLPPLIQQTFAPEPQPAPPIARAWPESRIAQISPPSELRQYCAHEGRTFAAGQADGGQWAGVCTGPEAGP